MQHVNVHYQTTMMTPDSARHEANAWLSMNAGHLLLAENPELVLSEPLQWRFDVVRSLPQRDRPGTVKRNIIGRMHMDAATGEVVNLDTLIQELTSTANALASSAV